MGRRDGKRRPSPGTPLDPLPTAAANAGVFRMLPDGMDGRCRVELAVECAGCGEIAELEQGSGYCWACTYQGWPS
jgi:hypothetical protein